MIVHLGHLYAIADAVSFKSILYCWKDRHREEKWKGRLGARHPSNARSNSSLPQPFERASRPFDENNRTESFHANQAPHNRIPSLNR